MRPGVGGAGQGEDPECGGLMLLLVWKRVSVPSCPHPSSVQRISGCNNSFTTVAPKILM